MMKISDTDIAIIKHLWDGRKSYGEIAEKMGLSANTVRTRVNRMLKSNAIQIICLVDPFLLEEHSSAIIGFKFLPRYIESNAEKLVKLKGVVISALVSGRFDAIAFMLFNKEFRFEDFAAEEVPKLKGLIHMETYNVLDGINYHLRYVLKDT
jgi:Lrp/AsnC family transcriptional regulator for asnA, asnC and gidA